MKPEGCESPGPIGATTQHLVGAGFNPDTGADDREDVIAGVPASIDLSTSDTVKASGDPAVIDNLRSDNPGDPKVNDVIADTATCSVQRGLRQLRDNYGVDYRDLLKLWRQARSGEIPEGKEEVELILSVVDRAKKTIGIDIANISSCVQAEVNRVLAFIEQRIRRPAQRKVEGA